LHGKRTVAFRRCRREFKLARLEACLEVETAWNEIFLACAFRPIAAAMGYEFKHSEDQRRSIRKSDTAVRSLFGISEGDGAAPASDEDGAVHFDSSRVWRFFSEVVFGKTQRMRDPLEGGIHRGMVGADLIATIRHHALFHAPRLVRSQGHRGAELDARVEALVNRVRFDNPEAMKTHIRALFRRAWADDTRERAGASAAEDGVVLWGRRIALADVMDAVSAPQRPC